MANYLDTSVNTLASTLRDNGYASGHFGKWHMGSNYPYRPQDRGFDESVWFPSSHIGSVSDFWGNDYFDDTYWHNGKKQKSDARVSGEIAFYVLIALAAFVFVFIFLGA